jgi:hypothetical protein
LETTAFIVTATASRTTLNVSVARVSIQFSALIASVTVKAFSVETAESFALGIHSTISSKFDK